jgi:2-C-methyl-D-erythritol 4-phosphate cytidylyltransferase/2-C-methyl-D-erythritol 2,4-cyclodiphosphate synthase
MKKHNPGAEMAKTKTTAAIIVAAGNGERMGGDTPKQYNYLFGKRVIEHSIIAFQGFKGISSITVLVNPEHEPYYASLAANYPNITFTQGGASRQESVLKGLITLQTERPDYVLIHDAARPFIDIHTLARVMDALEYSVAVIPVVKIADTVKYLENNYVKETLDRNSLCNSQTPQGFNYATILELHQRYAGASLTDDASLVEKAGLQVQTVEGNEMNKKLTTQNDWIWAETLYSSSHITVTGQGYDVHRFTAFPEGTPKSERVIRIGGIDIEQTEKLAGHSDADVVLHAITDAILGATGNGDIGEHFPPTDNRWKNADSAEFITHALGFVQNLHASINNVDITIICERPKIGPHKTAMKKRVANMLDIEEYQVNIKATTTEGLGFTGRKEGIAAMATVTLNRPVEDQRGRP